MKPTVTVLQYLALKHLARGGDPARLHGRQLWPLQRRGLVVWPKRGTWKVTPAGLAIVWALEDAAVKPPAIEVDP